MIFKNYFTMKGSKTDVTCFLFFFLNEFIQEGFVLYTQNTLVGNPVGCGCRIRRKHLCRDVKLSQRVSCVLMLN